jgi:hypothetical protein
LSHVRSRLSAQSTRSLLCLGNWSINGFVHDSDVLAVAKLPDIRADEEEELVNGWDYIVLNN